MEFLMVLALLFALLLALALTEGDTIGGGAADADRPRRGGPRILFNVDGGSASLAFYQPPITLKQLCRTLDELEGTAVEVFIRCGNMGDDTLLYRTQVGEIYGYDVKDWTLPEKYRDHPKAASKQRKIDRAKLVADNNRALLDAGHDPMEVLAARTHQLGMQFWASLRMNDVHEDDSTRWWNLRSEFKKQNRHLLIGSPYPDTSRGYSQDDYTWAFDFAFEKVRSHKLAIIAEVCENYEVDGYELDFQRGPWYFRPGLEQQGMPLMTDFVRRVHARVDEISRAKGHPLTLAVRVPPRFELAESLGLDVRTWIEEGLFDVVAAMDPGYLDMNADLGAFVEAARGTGVRIAGGLEQAVAHYRSEADAAGWIKVDNDMMVAAAASHLQKGADGIYFFNFDCHRRMGLDKPYSPEEMALLNNIGDPDFVARHDKHYFVTVDTGGRTPEEGGTSQLPALLGAGEQRTFTFTIGDDLATARRDGSLRSARLRLAMETEAGGDQALKVTLNGEQLAPQACTPGECALLWEAGPARRGRNDLTVALKVAPADTAAPVRISGVEVFVKYAAEG